MGYKRGRDLRLSNKRGRDLRLSTDPVSVEARLDGLRVDAT